MSAMTLTDDLPSLPAEVARRRGRLARRPVGVRRTPAARAVRHQPAGAGQAPDRHRARLPRCLRRPAVTGVPAVGGRRLGLGVGRHVGDRRPVARLPPRALPTGPGSTATSRSRRSRWTRRPTCRGGRRRTATTTFGQLVVRVLDETAQHAGHCDIVREVIDGRGGGDAGRRGRRGVVDGVRREDPGGRRHVPGVAASPRPQERPEVGHREGDPAALAGVDQALLQQRVAGG